MGSSAKKKREKKQDFQKTKLKVGKTRPKNTNATDTSFSAKSIVLKQQNIRETARDSTALFNHNLSLLNTKNESQRRDALIYLTTALATSSKSLPQPASVILSKAQPLILDGNLSVRQHLVKLLKALPHNQLGSLDQVLLYTRAGLTHLSTDIRLTALDVLDWLIETQGEAVVNVAGSWLKSLRTFQSLLSWHGVSGPTPISANDKWSVGKPTTNLGSSKLLVHQVASLARFLTVGLTRPPPDPQAEARRAAELFPLWQTGAHMISNQSNPFGHLNLFGPPRDIESEVYDNVDQRIDIFTELELDVIFATGVKEAKTEGGEVGRAAAMVEKALKLVD